MTQQKTVTPQGKTHPEQSRSQKTEQAQSEETRQGREGQVTMRRGDHVVRTTSPIEQVQLCARGYVQTVEEESQEAPALGAKQRDGKTQDEEKK